MLLLPDRELTSDIYGIYKSFSKYAGVNNEILKYGWQHGWIPEHVEINPYVVASFRFDQEKYKINGRLCVALEEQARFLKENGFNSVAIGHPIIYFDLTLNKELNRNKETVLIVPAHGFSEEDVDGFYDFKCVNEIIEKNPKKKVFLLAHQHDYDAGKYKKYEGQIGIVKGAIMEDANTFLRMKYIFSQFEYVCFGSFTSAIVYASLFGAKCFLAENYFLPNENVYLKNQKWACGCLNTAKEFNKALSRQEILKRYPFVGDCLENAGYDIDISKWELGFQNKLNPSQARELIEESQSFNLPKSWFARKANGLFRRLGMSLPFPE